MWQKREENTTYGKRKKIVDLSTTISVIMLNVYDRGVPVSAQLYTVNYRTSLFF